MRALGVELSTLRGLSCTSTNLTSKLVHDKPRNVEICTPSAQHCCCVLNVAVRLRIRITVKNGRAGRQARAAIGVFGAAGLAAVSCIALLLGCCTGLEWRANCCRFT